MYFFHEAFQCLSTVERNALFNTARAREQCMPFTFNHQLLVSCLGNQVFKGAQALESTSQSGCWWALSSFETWSSHSWWKLLDWTRFFWGFVLEKVMFSISMGTPWLVKFTAQFFHLLTVFQEHLNLAGALKLMFAGALSSAPVALSAAAPSLRSTGISTVTHGVICYGSPLSIQLQSWWAAEKSRCVSQGYLPSRDERDRVLLRLAGVRWGTFAGLLPLLWSSISGIS